MQVVAVRAQGRKAVLKVISNSLEKLACIAVHRR